MHLLFHSGFLPTAGAKHYLFGLTENVAPFLREAIRRPHKAEVSIEKMPMIWVIDASGVDEYLPVNPLMHFVGGNDSGIWLPVIGPDEINRRIWPADIYAGHASPPYPSKKKPPEGG